MENVTQSIKILSDLIEKKANNELSRFNITISQARILIYILRCPGQLSMKELERVFNVSQATMQGTIARMEKKGYLCTVYLPTNRRQKLVVLTDYGKRLAADMFHKIYGVNDWLAAPLTTDEQKEFIRLVEKMHKAIQ